MEDFRGGVDPAQELELLSTLAFEVLPVLLTVLRRLIATGGQRKRRMLLIPGAHASAFDATDEALELSTWFFEDCKIRMINVTEVLGMHMRAEDETHSLWSEPCLGRKLRCST